RIGAVIRRNAITAAFVKAHLLHPTSGSHKIAVTPKCLMRRGLSRNNPQKPQKLGFWGARVIIFLDHGWDGIRRRSSGWPMRQFEFLNSLYQFIYLGQSVRRVRNPDHLFDYVILVYRRATSAFPRRSRG